MIFLFPQFVAFNHCLSICDEAPPTTTCPAHRAHIRHVRPLPAGCGRRSPPPWTWRRPAAPSASPASCGWPAAPPGCRRSSPAGGDEEQRQFRHVFPISEGRLAELRRSIQRVGAPGDSRTQRRLCVSVLISSGHQGLFFGFYFFLKYKCINNCVHI